MANTHKTNKTRQARKLARASRTVGLSTREGREAWLGLYDRMQALGVNGVRYGNQRKFRAMLKVHQRRVNRRRQQEALLATLAQAAHNNPNLPLKFVADTLQGRAEAIAGQTTPYRFGLMKGKIKIAEDFNAPLDPLTFTDHTQAATTTEPVTLREAFQRIPKIPLEVGEQFKSDIRELGDFLQPEAVSRSVPLVELTDGQRTIAVFVEDRAQFNERFVRAWHGEHVGEAVTFPTEALLRQALGPDLSAPETFEWVRQFLDDEIPYERFIAGRDG